MPVVVRNMRPADARAFLEVHHAAVRGAAAKDYPSQVIEAWAPMPITESHVEQVRLNPDGEYRLLAEVDGQIVGLACLLPQSNEIRACYVAPSAARTGVGSTLLRSIERVAGAMAGTFLEADSSLTAEHFYRRHGYDVVARGEHRLAGGLRMACVKMRKELRL
jgi:putative acetyltransferase